MNKIVINHLNASYQFHAKPNSKVIFILTSNAEEDIKFSELMILL